MEDQKIIDAYNKLRKMADHLPEWEDASEVTKKMHIKTFKHLIEPVTCELETKVNKISKNG